MHPGKLVLEAKALDFPPHLLLTGLDMHAADRVLQVSGCCSDRVAVQRSVLPGCALAIPLTRAYMLRSLSEVVEASGATQAAYVDDISHMKTGSLAEVVNAVVDASVAFCDRVRALHLKVSTKSVVLASSPKLSRLIVWELRGLGIVVKSELAARALGITLSLGARRSASGIRKRLAAARPRFRAIGRFARITKRARLVKTGALPQAVWGHAVQGFSPSAMRALRTATGINQAGRCAITAIAITMGSSGDPLVKAASSQVGLWLDLWQKLPALRADARAAWPRIYARVFCEQGANWRRVTGPIGATIATLCDLGGKAEYPNLWKDPRDVQWLVDPVVGRLEADRTIAGDAVASLWARASAAWCAGGIPSGLDETVTLRWHAALSRHGPPGPLGMLECFLCGGYWTRSRRFAAGLVDEPTCLRRGAAEDTPQHLFYECPANQFIEDFGRA